MRVKDFWTTLIPELIMQYYPLGNLQDLQDVREE